MAQKLKSIAITAAIIATMGIALYFVIDQTRKAKQTIERLQSNIEAMRTDLKRNISTDGKQTAEVKVQTLTKEEIRQAMKEELKTLDIKARDVKNATTLQTQNVAAVKIDTIILRDTVVEYQYRDNWIDLKVNADSALIACRDCLLIVSHCRTRKFLWWTIRRYSGKTTVKNYSPYSTIQTIESIQAD